MLSSLDNEQYAVLLCKAFAVSWNAEADRMNKGRRVCRRIAKHTADTLVLCASVTSLLCDRRASSAGQSFTFSFRTQIEAMIHSWRCEAAFLLSRRRLGARHRAEVLQRCAGLLETVGDDIDNATRTIVLENPTSR
ncbi:hypothetical protein [Stenotrophomonas geniculata]|uniref:hypothetical protein n=1 Tax=Stenotrophomonas geniculata TaxID=86188 RepID=UPI002E796D17|nr:hypothetical protein [Stenotrophomonas geniculata]